MFKKNPVDPLEVLTEKLHGMPYSGIMLKFPMNPNRFRMVVNAVIDDAVLNARLRGNNPDIVDLKDEELKSTLFLMDEPFLEQAVHDLMGEVISMVPYGTYMHPDNVDFFSFFAMQYNHPGITEGNRKKAVQTLEILPSQLYDHFVDLKLGGLMVQGCNASPIEVLRAADRVRMKKKKDVSLFDLGAKEHVPMWKIGGAAPQKYWRDKSNLTEAVWYEFSQLDKRFSTGSRAVVIDLLKEMRQYAESFFKNQGLGYLLDQHHTSPLQLIMTYDAERQNVTKEKSIFDKTEKKHLHEWDFYSVGAPNFFYHNGDEQIVQMVYHHMHHVLPALRFKKRATTVTTLNTIPRRRFFFIENGFGGLITNKLKSDAEKKVLGYYDLGWQKDTQQPSLFEDDGSGKYVLT